MTKKCIVVKKENKVYYVNHNDIRKVTYIAKIIPPPIPDFEEETLRKEKEEL